jgi:hypothetical protein
LYLSAVWCAESREVPADAHRLAGSVVLQHLAHLLHCHVRVIEDSWQCAEGVPGQEKALDGPLYGPGVLGRAVEHDRDLVVGVVIKQSINKQAKIQLFSTQNCCKTTTFAQLFFSNKAIQRLH